MVKQPNELAIVDHCKMRPEDKLIIYLIAGERLNAIAVRRNRTNHCTKQA
jgi:hypothetical protein